MIAAIKPVNEDERLVALSEYNILDTLPEKEYDDITRIAAEICDTPISLLTLIDSDRQWFKSKIGLEISETKRELAFCAHAILNPHEIFIVDNPSGDERFFDNPFVTGKPHIAFYAGVPLVNNSGTALGTLCVIDDTPKVLSSEQKITLAALARQIVSGFEIRKMNRQLEMQRNQLEKTNQDLSRFANIVAHDIKSPFSTLAMGLAMLKDKYSSGIDADGLVLLRLLIDTSHTAINMIDGILDHSIAVNAVTIAKEKFTFGYIADELKKLITLPSGFSIEVINDSLQLYTSKYILLQILLNLAANAIKYNDKENGLIFLSASENKHQYKFSVKDNGPGIAPSDQERIFDLFCTLGATDRFNNKGTGIGLATVKRLLERMNGSIAVNSLPGLGSSFDFSISK